MLNKLLIPELFPYIYTTKAENPYRISQSASADEDARFLNHYPSKPCTCFPSKSSKTLTSSIFHIYSASPSYRHNCPQKRVTRLERATFTLGR